MEKSKFTRGMLCRDTEESPVKHSIVFFYNATRDDIALCGTFWAVANQRAEMADHWTPEEWAKMYSIKPPAPGTCFECDVKL